jgi:hypothetical protein
VCCLSSKHGLLLLLLLLLPLTPDSIKAIGYDMDYTLIHYDVNAWEVSFGGGALRGFGSTRFRSSWASTMGAVHVY